MSGDTEKIRILKDGCRRCTCDGTRLAKPHDPIEIDLELLQKTGARAGVCPSCKIRILSFPKSP